MAKIEVELKLQMDSLAEVKKTLEHLSLTSGLVEFDKVVLMVDDYYHYDVLNKYAVRLRRSRAMRDDTTEYALTVKKPVANQEGARTELEASISFDAHMTMQAAFSALGISPIATVAKYRDTYNIRNVEGGPVLVEVALDTVQDLGYFVELEYKGDNQDEAMTVLQEVRTSLGLQDAHEPKKGYVALMLEQISGVENQPAGEGTPQEEVPPNGSGSQEE